MQFPTLWKFRPRIAPALPVLTKLKHAVEAAQKTDYYRPLLAEAGLDSPASLARFESADELLKSLPCTQEEQYFASPDRFLNPAGRAAPAQPFRYPLGAIPRTALLSGGFRRASNVKVFTGQGSEKAMAAWGPHSIAASAQILRSLARQVDKGEIALNHLKYALVAFTGPVHGYISEEDRDLCWQVFQVPIFEQVLGYHGEPVADECEAHEGFHVHPENVLLETAPGSGALIITPLSGTDYPLLRMVTKVYTELDSSPCGCGKTGLRLGELETNPLVEYESAASAAD